MEKLDNCDLNSLYYNLIVPFALDMQDLGDELELRGSLFVSEEDICKSLALESIEIFGELKEKMIKILKNFNSELKQAFRSCAEMLIKYTTSKGINVLQRIKDKLRKAVKRMIDYEKTKKLLSKSIVESNNNLQVKSNITFDSSIDYRIRTEFGTTYRIEESLSNNIIFTKDQQYFINYVILNGDIKPNGFKKCDNIWKYCDEPNISNSFDLDTLKSQNALQFNLNTRKKQKETIQDQELLYMHCVIDSVRERNSLFNSKMDYEIIKNSNSIIEHYSIESFDWEETIKKETSLLQYFNNPGHIKKICWADYKVIKSEEFNEQFQIASERYFGSYTSLFKSNVKNDAEKLLLVKQIRQRCLRIKDYVCYQLIDEKLFKEYLDKQIAYIIDYYARNPLNQHKSNVIGWQVSPIFSKELIQQYPFEALLRVQGAYPRLVTLEKFEQLSSHPDFIKASSFDEIFSCYSAWIKQSKDYTGRLKQQFDIDSKLSLYSIVRRKVIKIKNTLKPILAYRFLIEESMRHKQEKGENINQNESDNETQMFKEFLIYMYILSCLKHESFNPNSILRTAVICSCKIKGIKFDKDEINCGCVYRLRRNQVKKILQTLETKREAVKKELERNFTLSDEREGYILNSEVTKQLKEKLSTEEIRTSFVKSLSHSFEVPIIIDFE